MNRNSYFFYIRTPEGLHMTWIGGRLKPSRKPGHVWLTNVEGQPQMELPKEYVRPTTLEETAQRCIEDQKHALEDQRKFLERN